MDIPCRTHMDIPCQTNRYGNRSISNHDLVCRLRWVNDTETKPGVRNAYHAGSCRPICGEILNNILRRNPILDLEYALYTCFPVELFGENTVCPLSQVPRRWPRSESSVKPRICLQYVERSHVPNITARLKYMQRTLWTAGHPASANSIESSANMISLEIIQEIIKEHSGNWVSEYCGFELALVNSDRADRYRGEYIARVRLLILVWIDARALWNIVRQYKRWWPTWCSACMNKKKPGRRAGWDGVLAIRDMVRLWEYVFFATTVHISQYVLLSCSSSEVQWYGPRLGEFRWHIWLKA